MIESRREECKENGRLVVTVQLVTNTSKLPNSVIAESEIAEYAAESAQLCHLLARHVQVVSSSTAT
jgi:hypothetical protein